MDERAYETQIKDLSAKDGSLDREEAAEHSPARPPSERVARVSIFRYLEKRSLEIIFTIFA